VPELHGPVVEIVSIKLYRDGPDSAWGFRLKGGSDVDGGSPLEVVRGPQSISQLSLPWALSHPLLQCCLEEHGPLGQGLHHLLLLLPLPLRQGGALPAQKAKCICGVCK